MSIKSQNWDKIFDQSPIGIAISDKDGNFIKVNKKLCSILGYSSYELLKYNVADITHPSDLVAYQKMTNKVRLGESNGYEMVKRYLTKNNQAIYAKITVWGIYDDENNLINFISHIQTILNTDKLKIEQVGRTQIQTRPTLSISEFIADNWKGILKIIVPFTIAAISAGISIGVYIKSTNLRINSLDKNIKTVERNILEIKEILKKDRHGQNDIAQQTQPKTNEGM